MYSHALMALVEKALEACKKAEHTVGTVESCTGGLLATLMTEIPGASSMVQGGLVTYCARLKNELGQVPEGVLAAHGVVSAETASAMAEYGKHVLNVDFCLSTTGVAGPDGGTDEHPVGCVYIGISGPRHTHSQHYQLEGDRTTIRLQAATKAFEMLYAEIQRQ